MQQGSITNINWNAGNFFSGYVIEDNIYTYTGEIIGVNLKKYNELEQALMKCKNRLIELGEIKVPKTQEELMKEQAEVIEKQNKAITALLEELHERNKDIKPSTTEHSGEDTASTTASSTNSESIINTDEGASSERNKK